MEISLDLFYTTQHRLIESMRVQRYQISLVPTSIQFSCLRFELKTICHRTSTANYQWAVSSITKLIGDHRELRERPENKHNPSDFGPDAHFLYIALFWSYRSRKALKKACHKGDSRRQSLVTFDSAGTIAGEIKDVKLYSMDLDSLPANANVFVEINDVGNPRSSEIH